MRERRETEGGRERDRGRETDKGRERDGERRTEGGGETENNMGGWGRHWEAGERQTESCLLYTSPSPRDFG